VAILSSSKKTRPPYKFNPDKITLRFLFANRDGLTATVECKPSDTVGEVKAALLSVWPSGTYCFKMKKTLACQSYVWAHDVCVTSVSSMINASCGLFRGKVELFVYLSARNARRGRLRERDFDDLFHEIRSLRSRSQSELISLCARLAYFVYAFPYSDNYALL